MTEETRKCKGSCGRRLPLSAFQYNPRRGEFQEVCRTCHYDRAARRIPARPAPRGRGGWE